MKSVELSALAMQSDQVVEKRKLACAGIGMWDLFTDT